MTRKHFNAIAQAMANGRPKGQGSDVYDQWERTCWEVMTVCAGTNSNFDKATFMNACIEWEKVDG